MVEYMPVECKLSKDLTPNELRDILPRIVGETGITNDKLADIVGISFQCLYDWYNDYPEFKAAIVAARDRFNVEVLEKSLIKRAQGYEVTETETGMRGAQTVEIEKTKHVPADTAALTFFLKHRDPERWKEKEDNRRSELAEVFAMIINRSRTLPATRTDEPMKMDIPADD